MKKLIIQIPCYNEEHTLPAALADLPRHIDGIDIIETQIINDGSTDRTVEVARRLGVRHIVSFKRNMGLAAAFRAGVDNALGCNADILVNTDGDNQYCGGDIAKLVRPILTGEADIVVGSRPIDTHPDFSLMKKRLQKIGSWAIRRISKTDVKDASSGFRAYDRDAMMRINIFSSFSYCIEMLMQAGYNNMKIVSVDVGVNPKTRDSRLFKNTAQYLWQSGRTILHIFLLYRAAAFFSALSALLFLVSAGLIARYSVLTLGGASKTVFWPSLVFAAIFFASSFIVYFIGTLASLMAANRKLSEETLYRLRKMDVDAAREKHAPNRERFVDVRDSGNLV